MKTINCEKIDDRILKLLKNPITTMGSKMWDEIALVVDYLRNTLHFSRESILAVINAKDGYGRNPEVPHKELIRHIDYILKVNKKNYKNYLLCPEWKKKRKFIIQRDKICQGCLDAPIHQVHHLTYRNVGNELMFELVGLCRECHSRCHQEYK
jgi:hypothetical protein